MPDLLHIKFSLHPWMSSDFGDSGSVLAVVTEELQDEVLERVGEVLAARLLPVGRVVALQKQIVEVLVLFGFLEWKDALHNNEQDDSSRKHINLGAVIRLALLDLRSHVRHRASVRLQVVDFSERGEAEIGHFQVHVFVDEDVFKLEVSVNDALAVHVLKHIAHLRKEVTTAVLAHAAKGLAQIEEQTAGDELEQNVNEVADLPARWLHDSTVRAITNNLNDIWVLEALQDLDLLLHGLDGVLVSLQELLAKELEGDGFSWVVDFASKINF